MNTYHISVIPGDGIGKEVVPAGLRVLDAVSAIHGFRLHYRNYDWSCELYKTTGKMMPDDGIERLGDSDAIFLGAVGFPGVPDHISLWNLLIPIRREFDQYVNLRPVRLLAGVPCPLANADKKKIDFWIVRENTEGEYSQVGGRMFEGTDREFVVQQSVFTRYGTDRIIKFAFEFAKRQKRLRVTSATKSNGIYHAMPYWDERFSAMATGYPDIIADQYHIDILSARFVLSPERFDVVVGSNLFGDILSDLGPGATGTIAVAPSANINPERRHPSMFEPVHGSAPDIAGKAIANPIGQIWSAAMMLEHLGEQQAASTVIQAIERALCAPNRRVTPDLGGNSSTHELTDSIVANLT